MAPLARFAPRPAGGIWIVYRKKSSTLDGPVYDDLVEEALCFGWIDSQSRRADDDRMMQWYAKPRTRRRATQTLLDTMAEEVGGRPVHPAVLHADSLEDAQELRQRVTDQFDGLELYVTEFPPVMGTHTGPGLLGLAFHADA